MGDGSEQRHRAVGVILAFLLAFIPFLGIVSSNSIHRLVEAVSRIYENVNPSPDSEQDINYSVLGSIDYQDWVWLVNLLVSVVTILVLGVAFVC